MHIYSAMKIAKQSPKAFSSDVLALHFVHGMIEGLQDPLDYDSLLESVSESDPPAVRKVNAATKLSHAFNESRGAMLATNPGFSPFLIKRDWRFSG
ncbi:uncharacterized protein Z518_06274 [Rhinocladiella mackenziei CBS 650.93]|uniref:Uncharacterized protein n=1 Tax=Rhinocladiella mackenziei CBS 650.93 TaxID=1442369 RepID=A0A0D2FTI6_9EURO|nr:uncharacterized protein Z518_06274 [Rhinocladiella mackenziei CBS 650.93]KIX05402.1 hypothetical protein Z518_06274 [Rhinocladiella mackenziei CBS 650.93]